MGTGGLEWDVDDVPDSARLQQKTQYVGTGAQINALAGGDLLAGMRAVCITTGSGFVAGNTYRRNDGNTAWKVDGEFVGTGAEIAAVQTHAGLVAFCTSTGSGFTATFWYHRNTGNTAWIRGLYPGTFSAFPASPDNLDTIIHDQMGMCQYFKRVSRWWSNVKNFWVPTFIDNFSVNNALEQSASDIGVDTTNLEVDYDSQVIDPNTALSIDPKGSAFTDALCGFDATIIIDSKDDSNSDQAASLWFGLWSANSASGSDIAQDGFGFYLRNLATIRTDLKGMRSDGETATFTEGTLITTAVVAKEYFCRCIRTSLTNIDFRIYDNAADRRNNENATASLSLTVTSALTNVRYFKVMNFFQTGQTTANFEIGSIYDVVYYDNIDPRSDLDNPY